MPLQPARPPKLKKPRKAPVKPGRASAIPAEERERDHRGILLPARHKAGGIITPQ